MNIVERKRIIMEFVYKEEFWFISTFLNTSLVEGDKKSQEIEKQVRERISNLKKEDIYYKIRDEIGDNIILVDTLESLTAKRQKAMEAKVAEPLETTTYFVTGTTSGCSDIEQITTFIV